MRLARLGLVLPLLFACARVNPPVSPRSATSETTPASSMPAPAQVDASPRPAAGVAASGEAAAPAAVTLPGKPPARPLHELIEQLSERDRYYFSDNYVSNETS